MPLYRFITLMLVAPVEFFQRKGTMWVSLDCLCVLFFFLTFFMIYVLLESEINKR